MKKKILFVSHLSDNISFNNVSRCFIEKLLKKYKDFYDLYIYNVMNTDYPKNIKNNLNSILNIPKKNIYCLPRIKKSSNSAFDNNYEKYIIYGCRDLNKTINEINCDYVFILCDLWHQQILINQINKNNKRWNGKIMAYIPIDLVHLNKEILDFKCHAIIVTNKDTENEIKKILPNQRTYILPHMIIDDFYEIEDKNEIIELKKKYLGEENVDKYIIGAINANCIRKRWDILIDAFCQYHAFNNNSILFIKTNCLNNIENNNGFDFNNLIKYNCEKYNIKDEVIKINIDRLSDKELNEVYNVADIFINSTDGEGFGLTPFEAARAKKITILPNNSCFKEFYDKSEYNFNFLIKPLTFPTSYIRENRNLEAL